MAVAKNTTLNFILDIVLVILAFLVCITNKPSTYAETIPAYSTALVIFLFIWVSSSFLFQKYKFSQNEPFNKLLITIIKSNIIAFGLVAIIMYLMRSSHYSRLIVLGTIGLTTMFELVFLFLKQMVKNASPEYNHAWASFNKNFASVQSEVLDWKEKRHTNKDRTVQKREEALFVEINREVYNFVFQHANIASPKTLIINTTSRFNITSQLGQFDAVVNLKRINDIRYLNKFFETANRQLPKGGIFIACVETKNQRKERILNKFIPPFNFVYYFFDFILKRVFPKFAITKKIYFFLTRGNNRVLTKAETFGRLYSCGFNIVAEKEIDKYLYFVAVKNNEPLYPSDPTYGPFIKLNRVGCNNKPIKVYKLRTMHPYAEYLQEYMYLHGGLKEGGKFKDDFRVSTIGKFLRCLWLDELPMLINLLRGDMKIVGVRPLSNHYFGLYSKELQEKRTQFKPGLIPPFYADNPKTLEEIQDSEMRYLLAYQKYPFRTDIKYFFISVYNIVFRKLRSS